MASFLYLIFIALVAYSVSAKGSNASEDVTKVKRHAYIAAAPAPVLAYSVHPSHPAQDDGQYWAGKYDKISPIASPHAAVPHYAASHEDDGQYWPGKYDKIASYPAAAPHATAAAVIPYHAAQPAGDDGQYWPGKYDSVHPAAVLYPSHSEDDGQYWPGKYDSVHPAAAPHPSHPEDDGQYWPGKYDTTHVPALPYYVKPAHTTAYHH